MCIIVRQIVDTTWTTFVFLLVVHGSRSFQKGILKSGKFVRNLMPVKLIIATEIIVILIMV